MNFYELVIACILFICGLLMFYVIRVFAYPFDIGYPSLDPRPLTGFIWNYFSSFLLILLCVITVVIVILFFIYLIVRNIPIFGPLIVNNTPFRELRDLRLFALIENLIDIVFSGFSKESFVRFFRTIGEFFWNSFHFIRANAHLLRRQPKNTAAKDGSGQPNVEGEAAVLTQSERFQIRDEFVRCLREKMATASPDDPQFKHKLVDMQNQAVRTQCQVLNIGTYLKILMAQRKFFAD
jgi:hypothetical protein